MRSWVLVVLLGSIALAGCASDGTSDDVALETDPAPSQVPRKAETTEEPTAPPREGNDLLRNITSLYWATDDAWGAVALETTLDFGADNECWVASGVVWKERHAGVQTVFVAEDGTGEGWSSYSSGGFVHARAGPVDTYGLLSGGGYGGSSIGRGGSLDGTWTFTRIGEGIEPADGFDFLGGRSMALDIECDRPFDVVSARIGHEAFVRDGHGMEDGSAAGVPLAGSLALEAGQELAVTAPEGHVRFGSSGLQAGQVVLVSPEEEATSDLLLEPEGHLLSGPGTYGVGLTRGGALFDGFWAAAYGVEKDLDLRAGLKDGPTMSVPI